MKYTYLLIDFFTIIVPFLFSFHPKLNFYKTWKAFFPAVILTGILFIAWDMYFTCLGVWGFNPTYLIGLNVANLPIEELLFFLCIPYSCVFTYHCLNILIKKFPSQKTESAISWALLVFALIISVVYHESIYTLVTFLSLIALIVIAKFVLKFNWLGKFYIIYSILLIPFLIVNGLLTGTGLDNPVVWYNNSEIIGLRILTIPFEDIFYGMDLILLNLMIYLPLKK
jgi:lycopene cyclase domain-containing protein